MDFKKLFIGGLCASAVLAGCTKELSAPSVEGNQAVVSLGEGLTITGVKGSFGAETKAEFGTNFVPHWVESDVLGAAWYDVATKGDKASDQWVSEGNKYGTNFMSNQYFRLSSFKNSAHTQAAFTADANLFAGAYVLYFPADMEWSQLKGSVPVTVKEVQTMDITPGKELEHLHENIFAYTTYRAVPGGTQKLDDFTLNQLNNVLRVHLSVDPDGSTGLIAESLKNIKIANVIVAGDMYTEGEILMPEQKSSTFAEVYNDKTGAKTLDDAKYKNSETVHSVNLTVKGEAEGYTFTEFSKELEKPFYISALPIESVDLEVYIVTDKGDTYVGELSEENKKALEAALESNGGILKGKLVNLHVVITDKEEYDGKVYTAAQFRRQWEKFNVSGKGETLEIMADLSKGLENYDLNVLGDMKIVCNYPLTVGDVNIEGRNAKLTVTGTKDFKVNGDFTMGSAADVTTSVTAPMTVTGDTNIKGSIGEVNAKKLGDVLVEASGVFTLTNNVTFGAIDNDGEVILQSVTVNGPISNNQSGKVTIGDDKVVISTTGSISGKGTISNTSQKTLANRGTITLEEGSSAFIKNHGTINLNAAAEYSNITNAAATTSTPALPAGTINVNKADATLKTGTNEEGAVVNVKKTNVLFTTNTFTNNGTVVVSPGVTLKKTTIKGEGTIDASNATKDAPISLQNVTFSEGTFILNQHSADLFAGTVSAKAVTYVLNDKDYPRMISSSKVPNAKVTLARVEIPYTLSGASRSENGDIFGNGKDIELAKGAKLIVPNDFDFGTDGNRITVSGDDVTISSTKAVTVTLPNGNKLLTVKKGGKLTFSGKDNTNKMSFAAGGKIVAEGSTADVVFVKATTDLSTPVEVTTMMTGE